MLGKWREDDKNKSRFRRWMCVWVGLAAQKRLSQTFQWHLFVVALSTHSGRSTDAELIHTHCASKWSLAQLNLGNFYLFPCRGFELNREKQSEKSNKNSSIDSSLKRISESSIKTEKAHVRSLNLHLMTLRTWLRHFSKPQQRPMIATANDTLAQLKLSHR